MNKVTRSLRLKVCGMRDPVNIQEVAALEPDYLGFIFYPLSPRYVFSPGQEEMMTRDTLVTLKIKGITPVAVFVNVSTEAVMSVVETYGFTTVQLHGEESPAACQRLRDAGLTVFKAFSIAERSDLLLPLPYEGCCDAYVFDTKSPLKGGSGQRFEWELLEAYTGETLFLLSGGIGSEAVADLKAFSHPRLMGVDVNSRFEHAPGLKDVALLRTFITEWGNDLLRR